MDDNGREVYPEENARRNEESEFESNEEDIPWNSDDEISQSDSDDETTEWDRLLEFKWFDENAFTDEFETVLHNACRCLVSNEEFTLFMRKLLKRRVDVDGRNSLGQTALMVACKIGNEAAVREILKWRDDNGERADISAQDINGQTAIVIARHSNNTNIVTLLEQNAFLRAVEMGDTGFVQFYLPTVESIFEILHCPPSEIRLHSADNCEDCEHNSGLMKRLPGDDESTEERSPKTSKVEIEALVLKKDFITHSIWLEAVTIARREHHGDILNLLFSDDRYLQGFNEIGQALLQKAMEKYLAVKHDLVRLGIIELLLISWKFRAYNWILETETILNIVCKVTPRKKGNKHIQIFHLLKVLLQCGIDLNGRNNKEETFLMLACENRRIDIVQRLLNSTLPGFVPDVDAVDNSGKTALGKAKQNRNSEIVSALLKFKLISAVENGNESIVKSMLNELFDTSDIFLKSCNSREKRDDRKKENTDKFNAWRGAMYVAMEKYAKHEQILNYLLDSDILSSLEAIIGKPILHRLVDQIENKEELDTDMNLRLIEMLLKSGKINVNARSSNGYTALHLVNGERLASLLIRYGADVNKKENKGGTPFIISSEYSHKDAVFRTILKEAGALVDLDAADCNGRTALMIAVMNSRPDAVELLLNAGASVKISDQLGFTVLHHALYDELIEDDEFPRNSKELKKRNEIMSILFDAKEPPDHCYWFRTNNEWNEERMKIVEMLMQRADVDVNALNFENFSPLDLAEGWIPLFRSSIQNALEEKGAVLNAFRQPESQSTSDFYLDVRCRLTLQRLATYPLTRNAKYFDSFLDRLLTLIETFKEEIISSKDQQERTALHLVAISSSIISVVNRSYEDGSDDECKESHLTQEIASKLISLGCSVNATDIYGRTALEYADDVLQKLFKSKGAGPSSRDKDGNTAIDDISRNNDDLRSPFSAYDKVKALYKRNNETYFLNLMSEHKIEISVQNSDSLEIAFDDSMSSDTMSVDLSEEMDPKEIPKLLWEDVECASCHLLANEITNDVNALMDAVAEEIKELDGRFEIRHELVGSSYEGTRLNVPNEFDFCFVLTKFSEICEVSHCPELPTGFVRLKSKPSNIMETITNDFNGVFSEDGILITEKLNWHFRTILRNALVNIESRQSFEWNLELQRAKISKWLRYNKITNSGYKINKVVSVKMIKPLNVASVNAISIDIVPCIHIDGWWPDEAISNVSEEIKTGGCNLVFDRPQGLYNWVPYSESCARISFSKAESEMIKQSCDTAKDAYMIGKMMIENSSLDSNYVLKNCLLYCIEALTPTSEKASQLGLSFEEMESKFRKMDRYLWLKCLMKCHLDFVAQDFCPCYFLPNFSSPIGKDYIPSEEFLKHSSLCWMTDGIKRYPDQCSKAFAFYRFTSNASSVSGCQLPAPDPLWERFDRDKLIASLCEIAYK